MRQTLVTLMVAGVLAGTAPAGAQKKTAPPNGVELSTVVKAIQEVLIESEKSPVAGFPALSSVEVSLQSTVTKEAGGKIKFLIFSIGGGRTTEQASTLTFELTPPKPAGPAVAGVDPAQFKKSLTQQIQAAKVSFLETQKLKLPLVTSKVTIEVKFAIDKKISGGIETAELLPIGVEVTGEVSKNEAHSATLTFGQ